jgi:uncharacterized DUF497 family protein
MKIFNWDEEKNNWLKRERGVSFEQVVFCIEEGKLLDIVRHPNQERYKGQRLYIVDIDDYAFVVPYVESEGCIFLKTVFPSRKYTSMYLRKGGKNETV